MSLSDIYKVISELYILTINPTHTEFGNISSQATFKPELLAQCTLLEPRFFSKLKKYAFNRFGSRILDICAGKKEEKNHWETGPFAHE